MENIGKTAADRVRDAEDVVTAIEVQGPAVAKAIEAMIFEGEAPKKITVADFLERLGGALHRHSGAYRSADAAHTAETSGDARTRASRDEAAAGVREVVTRTESVVRGAFGADATRAMGLDVTWATRPDLLAGQARNAVALVRKAEPGKPIAAGVKVDLEALATAIEATCDTLDAAIGEVVREERAAQATHQSRERAAGEWERRYAGIAEVFTGLCVLAGHDELAARVKPPARKGSKHDVTPPTPPAPSAPAQS